MHILTLAQQLASKALTDKSHSDLVLPVSDGPSPGFSPEEALLVLIGCHEQGIPTPGPSNASLKGYLQHLLHPLCF